MLSRKLLGSIAVGVLSVALVPATWARTHSRLASRAVPSKQLLSHSGTIRPVTTVAPKAPVHHALVSRIGTHKLTTKAPVGHKLVSRHTLHSKLTSRHTTGSKLASKSIVSHKTLHTRTSKATSLKVTSSKLTSTKVSSTRMASAHRPVINPKLARKAPTT